MAFVTYLLLRYNQEYSCFTLVSYLATMHNIIILVAPATNPGFSERGQNIIRNVLGAVPEAIGSVFLKHQNHA